MAQEEKYKFTGTWGWGFHQIPDMAIKELTLLEYKLFGHYMSVNGYVNSGCWESVETTAENANIAVNSVKKGREGLAAKGYIIVARIGDRKNTYDIRINFQGLLERHTAWCEAIRQNAQAKKSVSQKEDTENAENNSVSQKEDTVSQKEDTVSQICEQTIALSLEHLKRKDNTALLDSQKSDTNSGIVPKRAKAPSAGRPASESVEETDPNATRDLVIWINAQLPGSTELTRKQRVMLCETAVSYVDGNDVIQLGIPADLWELKGSYAGWVKERMAWGIRAQGDETGKTIANRVARMLTKLTDKDFGYLVYCQKSAVKSDAAPKEEIYIPKRAETDAEKRARLIYEEEERFRLERESGE